MAASMKLFRCAGEILRKQTRVAYMNTRFACYSDDNSSEKVGDVTETLKEKSESAVKATSASQIDLDEQAELANEKVNTLGRFIEKWESMKNASTPHTPRKTAGQNENNQKFATLFRNSNFVAIGQLNTCSVRGRVRRIVGKDLYIDIGTKFYCVCRKPKSNAIDYQVGTILKMFLNDVEMANSFLGSEKAVSLLEADATIIDLHNVERRG